MPIAGQQRAGSSDQTQGDIDPWSGERLTEIQLANAEDLERAYASAQQAQADWAKQPPGIRAAVMRGPADAMDAARRRSPAG